MKKTWVIIVNIFIMILMLVFVVFYSDPENKVQREARSNIFENTTVTMEHVTENYLEGEQRICDVWARYIGSKNMTIEEAVSTLSGSLMYHKTLPPISYFS